MKKTYILKTYILLISLCTAVHSRADLIAYEGFDYGSQTNKNLDNAVYNGGTGWSGGWTKSVLGGGLDYLEGTNLTYGSLETAGGSFINGSNGVKYFRSLSSSISDATSDQTVWFSMLAYRSTHIFDKIIEWTPSSSTDSRMSFGHNNSDTSGEWEVGPRRYSTGTQTGIVASLSSATPDLIVGRIDLFTGTGTNDTITLFVNPTIGGAAPTGGTSYNLGDSARTIERIHIIGPANGIGLDEIRLGDTFSDVAVVIPEPSTMVLVGIALGSFLLFRRRR